VRVRQSIRFSFLTCSSTSRARKDLAELSSLGHFLKGSSAALGLSKVKTSCENIQHFGQLREGGVIITEAEAIGKITKSIARAREEYADAKTWLEQFYVSYRTKA
jgi:HPt (histidine-containing phosphotransfer) domain-containing protein